MGKWGRIQLGISKGGKYMFKSRAAYYLLIKLYILPMAHISDSRIRLNRCSIIVCFDIANVVVAICLFLLHPFFLLTVP
jgi:hypothetical protein